MAAASPPLNRVQGEGKISCWRQRKEEEGKRSPLCPSFFHSCWHHSPSSSYISFPRTEKGPRKQPPTAPLLYIQGQWRWRQQQMEVERRLSVSQKRKERKKGRKFCFIFENSPSSSLLLFQTEFSNLVFFWRNIFFFFILGKPGCVRVLRCSMCFHWVLLQCCITCLLSQQPAFCARVYIHGGRGGEAKSALLSRIARSYSFFSSLFVREYVQRSRGGY